MDFTGLQAAVIAQYDAAGTTYAFDPAPYGSADIDLLVTEVIGQKSWTMTAAAAPQVDLTHQTITVAGTCAQFHGQADVRLTMLFWLDQGDAELAVSMDLGPTWSFVGTFPALAGTVFADVAIAPGTPASYVFSSAPVTWPGLADATFVTGTNFYATVLPTAAVEPWRSVMALLGPFASTTAVGPISTFGNLPQLALTLGYVSTLTRYFPILKGHVQAQLISHLQEVTNEVGLRLGTSFDFGPHQGLQVFTVLKPELGGVLTLTGDFAGVTLPTPAQAAQDFVELIGADDLYSSLPSTYQGSTDLSLQRLTLGIGTVDLTPVQATLDIGMPPGSPGWPLGDFATVTDVRMTATVLNPFVATSRRVSVTVSGGVAIPTDGPSVDLVAQASATFAAGRTGSYTVQGGLAPGHDLTLPAGDLINMYLPSAVNLPDIVLGQLGVDFTFQSPTDHYGLYAGLDPAHPLVFTFGGVEAFTVQYANFHIENDSYQGGPGGGLVGAISIFGAEVDFAYQAPGNFKVTVLIPEFTVDLPTLADGLLGWAWTLPSWMPVITFPRTSLYVEAQGSGAGSTYTFALMAQPSFGTIIVQVEKLATGWVFAGGLQLDEPKIAAFDGLSMLSGMDVMFAVDELLFVFVSGDLDSGFTFPPTTDFEGGSGPDLVIPSFAGTVRAGFYFYGSMTLNVAGQKNLALVQHLLDLDADLTFQLMVFIGRDPTQNAYAQAGVQGKINESTTLSGYLGARMEAGEPQFYLEGIVSTTFQGSDGSHQLVSTDQTGPGTGLTAAFAFELTPDAALLSVSLIGSVTFGPVTLSDVVIVVGIDWELIPSLGFAAQIDLNAYGTTYDSSIALFFDSGDPDKSLFAGSVSDITLRQVADTIVGVVAGSDIIPGWLDALLAQVGISGTSKVTMPAATAAVLDSRDFTGITTAFNTAYHSTGYSFTAQNTLLVVGRTDLDEPGVWYLTNFPSSGVIMHYQITTAGDGSLIASVEPQFYYCMPPGGGSVTLGPPQAGLVFNSGVSLSGTLDVFMLHLTVQLEIEQNRGLSVDVELADPVDVLSGYLQLTGNADHGRGPRFSMSTYPVAGIDTTTNQPTTLPAHFYLDGRLIFLDLAVATTVDVTTAGLHLDFTVAVGDDTLGASYGVDTCIDADTGVTIGFTAEVHIHEPDFELFDVSLGTLDLNVSISIGMSFSVGPSGASLRLGASSVSVAGTTFHLPALDLDVSTQQLADIPGIVYDELKNLIWDFLKDAEHWLLWVGQGIMSGFEDVEDVLDDVYNALASVWGNEKMIVVAVQESLVSSQSVTVTITPPAPTDVVTQAMIDSARDWAQLQAATLVDQAVVDQLKKTSPQDVGNFRIDLVQDIDEEYDLSQNVNWFPVAQGPLPTLAALGFTDPTADQRFFTQASAQLTFHTTVTPDADFTATVARVSVSVRYNQVQVGTPYIFTSAVGHTWSAPWAAGAQDNFQLQYTVSWLNPAVQPVSSPWMDQKGTSVVLPITVPQAATPEPA